MYDAQYVYIRSVSSLPMLSPLQHQLKLKPVCCKKQPKKSYWPVTGCRNRGPLKYLNDSKLIVYESKWFPWPSRINFIPLRIFRGSIFWLRTFFTVSYSKPALDWKKGNFEHQSNHITCKGICFLRFKKWKVSSKVNYF